MKKYRNLKNYAMNLQVTRWSSMKIKVGISSYDEKIADKFPSILEPVIDQIEEVIVPEVVEEVIVPEEITDDLDEYTKEPLNYDNLSYSDLKELIEDRGLIIIGRKTLKNAIKTLKAADV